MPIPHEAGVTVIEERFTLLRWGALAGGVALDGLAVLARQSGTLAGSQFIVALSLGAALVFWGIVMPGLRIEFDRTLRQIRWRSRSLLKTVNETLPFHEIEDIVVRVKRDRSEGSRRYHDEYQLFLIAGARELPLSRTYSLNLNECERQAAALLELLGMEKQGPLLERSMRYAATHRRRVEAIGVARRLHAESLADATDRVRALEGPPEGDRDPTTGAASIT